MAMDESRDVRPFWEKERMPQRRPAADPDEEEETLTYRERQPVRFLNREKGAFDSVYSRGINTAGSVFERTALFHTGKEEETGK